jgi:hypothetical protein
MMALELGDLRELDFDLDLIGLDADKIEAILNPLEPDFAPGTEDEQGKLDQLEPKLVKCPTCNTEFNAREQM